MLVLLGPGYQGRDPEISALVSETGLTAYDLRARLRPGAWGVIRAIADEQQAEALVGRLNRHGLPACAISSLVGQDSDRRIVYLRGLRFSATGFALRMVEREMTIPYGALLVIVRGEVHLGRSPHVTTSTSSSLSLRPSTGNIGLMSTNSIAPDVFRESRGSAAHEVFAAADLHFATVPWIARIDAREIDFPEDFNYLANLGERLDRCIETLAGHASVRVDRGLRTSSLASHTTGPQRPATPLPVGPASTRRQQGTSDEHFDAYSRLVAEAERVLLSRKLT